MATTKTELAAALLPALETAAGSMATAVEAFRGAYIDAHAFDLARSQLGAGQLGQRLDGDKLHTMACTAHASYREAGQMLFDGQALQPEIELAADAILAGLKAAHPEAIQ